ncbi:MAG: site-specific tyrosine recombinase XerC [Planctomycetota bacterium]|nr:site-specific tyrosine recombinase XerC [Planctomycetota bacterium]
MLKSVRIPSIAVARRPTKPAKTGRITSESSAKHDRPIAEWLVKGRQTAWKSESCPASLSVGELILAYWGRHVDSDCVKGERQTSEQDNIHPALRFVRRLYTHTPAGDIRQSALGIVRDAMIEGGRCHKLINKDTHRVRAMFRCATSQERQRDCRSAEPRRAYDPDRSGMASGPCLRALVGGLANAENPRRNDTTPKATGFLCAVDERIRATQDRETDRWIATGSMLRSTAIWRVSRTSVANNFRSGKILTMKGLRGFHPFVLGRLPN